MNASLSGALVLALLAGAWFLGRRRSRPFLQSTDTSAVAALNRVRMERLHRPRSVESLLQDPAPLPQLPERPPLDPASNLAELAIPTGPRQRRQLLRQLDAWALAGPEQRLQAMDLALRWRHRCLLPLLRRGLRDPDPQVMAAAARAMAQFRGRTALLVGGSSQDWAAPLGLQGAAAGRALPPRRVLRTR